MRYKDPFKWDNIKNERPMTEKEWKDSYDAWQINLKGAQKPMIRVSIHNWFPFKKEGIIKASFSLVIHPHDQKILDCRYFDNGKEQWFNFPQKEKKFADGSKTEYFPYISYGDKDYQLDLKKAVMAAIAEKLGTSNDEVLPF